MGVTPDQRVHRWRQKYDVTHSTEPDVETCPDCEDLRDKEEPSSAATASGEPA